MPETYKIDAAGKGYIPEIAQYCYWEVVVEENRLCIIRRGGPLDTVILDVVGNNIEVSDWWGWGDG